MTVDKQFKGNVGTYLTAAKLSEMNLIALTTTRNTKGYDVIVMNPATNRGKGIQVKCTDKKDFPMLQFFLKDYDKEIQERIICDFVFVDISSLDKPRFFVVPMKEVQRLLRESVKDWMQNSKHLRKPLDEMIRTETKKQSWSLTLDEVLAFEDKWVSVTP